MQILSIHLQNIKSHRDTTLTFAAGINVLSGPNGIGKSTIFEAIGYALLGSMRKASENCSIASLTLPCLYRV